MGHLPFASGGAAFTAALGGGAAFTAAREGAREQVSVSLGIST